MAAAAAAGVGGQAIGRSSFSRAASSSSSPTGSGVKLGPNGAAFVSSGIPDLDRILGGGFLLGSVVMVMEDSDAPHHLLLLRAFMAQGVVHKQPLLFAGPMKDPRSSSVRCLLWFRPRRMMHGRERWWAEQVVMDEQVMRV
ncbi:hypothetical protein ACQ4PT_034665 [Festuca glaucescens]